MVWLKLAMGLPYGRSGRMDCPDCHGKGTLGYTNHGEVFTAHCFRCKYKDASAAPAMTPQERRELELQAQAFRDAPPALPEDFTKEIPPEGILWLAKGGLNHSDIEKYGFGYSPSMQRVIMPVFEGDEVVAVQARALRKGHKPKYIGQIRRDPRPAFLAPHREPTDVLVLTEDMLSACRVAKVCDAASLLGTNLMPSVLAQLAETGHETFALWMDDDAAGINARRKMRSQLQIIGKPVRLIKSDRDPKKHSLEEMRRLIWPSSPQTRG